MSVSASRTVSISPAAVAARNSSSVSAGEPAVAVTGASIGRNVSAPDLSRQPPCRRLRSHANVDRGHQGADRGGGGLDPEGGPGPPEAQARGGARAARPRRHPALPGPGARPEDHSRHRLRRQGAPVRPPLALQRARQGGQDPALARGVRVRSCEGHRAHGDPEADPERDRAPGGALAHAQAAREVSTPLRMPAEWAPHERTIVCWPAREAMWQDRFGEAKTEHAAVVNAIADFEPVTLAVDPSQEAEARAAAGGDVEVVAIPLDDSWARDSGPIFVTGGRSRAGVHFGFNAWGEKFHPYDDDAAFGTRILDRLGEERIDATDLVLEGGSIAVDGEGTLIATEQCLLHPSRNPGLSRERIEARLREALGVAGRLARPRARRGRRHGWPRRQHLRLDRAGSRAPPDGGRRGGPQLRALPG